MFFVMFLLKLLVPAIVGAIVGLICIGIAFSNFWTLWQTQRWKTTKGRITQAWIAEQRVKTRTVYQIKASYEYVVDHTQYQSERIFIGDRWSAMDHPTAKQQLRPYQPDAEVTVYYDPQCPRDAVLELRTHPALYWLLGGGSFFLCISLIVGAAILPSAMEICGITPTSTQAQPGAPAWCQ